jgi:hypothetical protein
MTFSDLYAMVFREEPARDKLQEIVNAHTYEDGGHWKWFLADLPKLGCDPLLTLSEALRLVWADDNVRIRALSYGICRMAMGASSLQKLVLVQCIEAAGKVSLRHVSRAGKDFAQQTGKNLVYFGPHHFDTEGQHTLEQDGVHAMIDEMTVTPEVSRELSAMVDRSFDLFGGFADDLFTFTCR